MRLAFVGAARESDDGTADADGHPGAGGRNAEGTHGPATARSNPLRAAVEDSRCELVAPEADPDALLAVGREGLREAARRGLSTPAVFVTDSPGHAGVAREEFEAALDSLAEGHTRTVEHPVLALSVGGAPVGRSALEATLVTREPAQISEYRVCSDGRTVAGCRADGVVVATPAGSGTYARAAGGPLVHPGAGLAVVPVAPFATRRDAWVLPGPVTLQVEREEGTVVLLADGHEAATVESGELVEVDPRDRLRLLEPSR